MQSSAFPFHNSCFFIGIIDKSGFITGSRMFYPTEDRTSNVRIIMLSGAPIGNFQASSGSTLQLVDGGKVTFPENAVTDLAGNTYSGIVEVTAHFLNPDDIDFRDEMPGDLVGIDVESNERALLSYGMIAVEISSPSGEDLQLAPGKEATLEFPVPSSILTNAPGSIPLWYFDEETGYWTEEGEAQLSEDRYVGNVSHFSFWNCDAPFPLIELCGQIFYENGDPAANVPVRLTVINSGTTRYGYTDDMGLFCGKVPKEEIMTLEIQDQCNNVVFQQDIGPFGTDHTLTDIVIPDDNATVTQISGILLNCDSDPVQEGVVSIRYGEIKIYLPVTESEGNFTYSFINCSDAPVEIQGYDLLGLKESLPITLPNAPFLDFGNLAVCEDLSEFLRFEFETDTVVFITPDIDFTNESMIINAFDSTANGGRYIYIFIPGNTVDVYTDITQSEIFLDLGIGEFGSAPTITVTVTYVGDTGDFVTGTMTGEYTEGQGNPFMSFTGNFSIKRE
jgi:hypothetical protein